MSGSYAMGQGLLPFPVYTGSVCFRLGGGTPGEPWTWRGLLSEGLGLVTTPSK